MKITFFCVQPVIINNEEYIEIIKEPIYNTDTEKLPYWMEELKKISNIAYENTVSIKTEKANEIFIKKDIEKISELIKIEKINAYVLFDYKLISFNLCIEIEMDLEYMSEEEIDELLKEEKNIYLKVRELIVKENEDSIISKWTDKTIENTRVGIKEKIEETYKYKIDIEKIKVKPSTGNISVFIDTKEIKNKEKRIEEFMKLNYKADRFEIKDPEQIFLEEGNKYYFGGRIHTITYTDKRNLISYYTIQYQVQQNWFYASKITKVYNKINEKILDRENKINFREKIKLINYFINKISIFEIENEAFKMAIENNNEKIYKKIEVKWNIEKTIENLKRYIDKFEKIIKEEQNHLIEFEKAAKSTKEEELKKEIKILNEERRQLEEKGLKDHLTRAYNRNKFEIDMKEYFKEKKEPIFLAFIDGDKFKNINDTYGHQAGDIVLKKIVDIMFAGLKENEVEGNVYRFGGEEFLLTMFKEKNSSALGTLNLIKEEIEKTEIEYKDKKIKFTISIGAVKAQEGQEIDEIIEIADQLVYKAKEKGRNRIEYIF